MTFAGALGVPDIRALRPIIPSPGKWRASAHCNPCPRASESHMARVTLLAGLPGQSRRARWEGRLPSVSELPMPTFLDLSEARLSGKHGVLHISLPRDLSFPRSRVHYCARLICRHIMIITGLLLARGGR